MTARDPSRRRWLLGGVSAAAVAGGIGWALRQEHLRSIEGTGDDDFWSLSFPRPEGGELALATMRGRPWVLNFWATWCPPCIREMPALERFRNAHAGRGWEVVGLAVDGPTPVREFLQRVPVSFPIGLAGFGGADLGKRLGNQTGGLPFTVVFDRRGRAVQRKLGETSYDELARWAADIR
ncbi:MAG TPA: TlpA disulfide reductase family protein, partial [Rubrivivax sp.]|nr:TlpA disulfide reductase family protein [Rubrivivax sp.]